MSHLKIGLLNLSDILIAPWYRYGEAELHIFVTFHYEGSKKMLGLTPNIGKACVGERT
jgi:hypothetical protein